MSCNPDGGAPESSARVTSSEQQDKVADAQMPMGWTSEQVAAEFGIGRTEMDAFAAN